MDTLLIFIALKSTLIVILAASRRVRNFGYDLRGSKKFICFDSSSLYRFVYGIVVIGWGNVAQRRYEGGQEKLDTGSYMEKIYYCTRAVQ